MQIILPAPHSKVQEEIILDPCSSVNLCGRQYGKTESGAARIVRFGLTDTGLYWWVGYDWSSASMRRAWFLLRNYTRMIWQTLGKTLEESEDYIHETNKILSWPNDTQVWLRTAQHPQSLSGEAIKGVVCDEFTLWGAKVWDEYLEATTLIKRGWACFIGIPKGDGNWGCKIYEDVAAGKRIGWQARRAPTKDNPLVDPVWLSNIERNTPIWLYRQEYEASIERGVGSAFPSNIVESSIDVGIFERIYNPRLQYFAFVDPAGGGACEYTMAICHKENNKIYLDCVCADIASNPEQVTAKFADKAKQYGIRFVTGDAYAGEWPAEQWRKRGIEYYISDQTASELYIEMQPLVKQGLVRLLDDRATNIQFEYLIHKSGSNGRDVIANMPGELVDRVNSIAGCAVLCHKRASGNFIVNSKSTIDAGRATGITFQQMYQSGRTSVNFGDASRSRTFGRMPR